MRFTIRVQRNPAGDAWSYTGQCVEIPGAISEGDTQQECVANTLVAVEDILEARRRAAAASLRRSRAKGKAKLVRVHA